MKLKFDLGQRVFIVTTRKGPIKEGIIYGFDLPFQKIMNFMKLPNFRIISNTMFMLIEKIIKAPEIKVWKFINIKPLALIFMRTVSDFDFKDLAAFFSVWATVVIQSSSSSCEKKRVLISRIFKTKKEAEAFLNGSGTYCIACGDQLSAEELASGNFVCKKCKKSVNSFFEKLSDAFTPKVINGVIYSASIKQKIKKLDLIKDTEEILKLSKEAETYLASPRKDLSPWFLDLEKTKGNDYYFINREVTTGFFSGENKKIIYDENDDARLGIIREILENYNLYLEDQFSPDDVILDKEQEGCCEGAFGRRTDD